VSEINLGITSCEGFCPYDELDEKSARYLESIDNLDEAAKVRAQARERREGCIGSVVIGPGVEECGLEHRDPEIEAHLDVFDPIQPENTIPEQRLAEGISPEVAILIREGKYSEAELLQESELL
jgi:hypothetical protein